ncbi:hypothetical protein [Pseudotabrizicola algicola]|uniref:Uncharacterized protein n=1 Tax=Pseudotabrizicola algicola TaxID=2709381 RepID=A0A6B3RXQ6_9RHOB|nr:hypothetical protein [Pseudotabrizicola algicola]NEX47912.1 hypothetical protein [Pseudotabrizicola algicola]
MAQSPKTPATPVDGPQDDQEPVFDKAQDDLPWPQDETLPADDEGNILPGNDPLDEDPNDNGDQEQFDPDDMRRKRLLGEPVKD